MQLRDIKNRFSRQPDRADPARAFGSEQQLMEEFRRQNYVPPQPATRAGRVLSGLKERIAAARQPLPEAPVYSAETYGQESAPDLGWEAAFAPRETPEAPPREAPKPSAGERFEAFRRTVYATPQQPQTSNYGAFPPGAYYRQAPAPVYQEIRLQSGPRRPNNLAKPVYEDISFNRPRAQAPRGPETAPVQAPAGEPLRSESTFTQAAAAVATAERPAPETAPPRTDAAPQDGFAYDGSVPEPDAGSFAQEDRGMPEPPPAPAPVARVLDWQYYFWSGSIVAGGALTLFGLIYACFL